jgi:hypothetical protein
MAQLIQIAGALLVLSAFVLAQLGVVDGRSRVYLAANVAGASVLAVDAWVHAQWGFLLLEGVWALAAAIGLATASRGA